MTESDAAALCRQLEDRLLQSAIRTSRDEVSLLLADDFIEIGSSGRVFDKRQIIDVLSREQKLELSGQNFSARSLAQDVVLVTYRAIVRDLTEGKERHSLRSSIWKLVNGQWQMVFHQGNQHCRAGGLSSNGRRFPQGEIS
jgi:hypothetical protein